jgi:hypothetical protein
VERLHPRGHEAEPSGKRTAVRLGQPAQIVAEAEGDGGEGVELGAGGQQLGRGGRLVLVKGRRPGHHRRPAQRREGEPAVEELERGAAGDEHPRDGRVSALGRPVQRRAGAGGLERVHVGAGVEQRPGDLGQAAVRREVQRRAADQPVARRHQRRTLGQGAAHRLDVVVDDSLDELPGAQGHTERR